MLLLKLLRKKINSISLCGKRAKKTSLNGTHLGVKEDQDGTLNVQLWQLNTSKSTLLIFILEVLIWDSLIMTMRLHNLRLTTIVIHGLPTSFIVVIYTSKAEKWRSLWRTSLPLVKSWRFTIIDKLDSYS